MKHELKRVPADEKDLIYERYAYDGYVFQLAFSVGGTEITMLQVYHDKISRPEHFTMVTWFCNTDFLGRIFLTIAIPVIISFIDENNFLELPATIEQRPCYLDTKFMDWLDEQLKDIPSADCEMVRDILDETTRERKKQLWN